EFLQQVGTAAGLALAESVATGGETAAGSLPLSNTGPGRIPHKPFGRSGETVSILGLGGHAIGLAPSLDVATRIVHEAIDAGVTFMDNAWAYHEGPGEEWMGRTLEGRRDRVFLMTKVCTHGRDERV